MPSNLNGIAVAHFDGNLNIQEKKRIYLFDSPKPSHRLDGIFLFDGMATVSSGAHRTRTEKKENFLLSNPPSQNEFSLPPL